MKVQLLNFPRNFRSTMPSKFKRGLRLEEENIKYQA